MCSKTIQTQLQTKQKYKKQFENCQSTQTYAQIKTNDKMNRTKQIKRKQTNKKQNNSSNTHTSK